MLSLCPIRKAREDEAAATKRLNDMIANYGDVIPRRDMESLQKQYQDLEEKMEQLKEDFTKLKDDHEWVMSGGGGGGGGGGGDGREGWEGRSETGTCSIGHLALAAIIGIARLALYLWLIVA